MKPAIFPKRGSGNGLSPQAELSSSGTEMPASVLEPLQARSSSSSSSSSSSNPFDAYGDAPPEAPGVKPRAGALTAFAAAPESQAAGSSGRGAAAAAASAAVLYPEGLPKFLGLLRPTITFGVGRLTLSRGMDFIAHFVAVSTLVFFVFILFAVNWMQKLCLPIVSNWTHNCTLAVGAFMALLAIFSWRSAANFDLKRSKVFLFLLGWRLHVFLLLSLLMVLGLALKPQLNAHVENSVRVCMLRQEATAAAAAAAAAFPLPISRVSLLPTLPLPVLNYAGPAHPAPWGVRTPENAPAAQPAAANQQQQQQQQQQQEANKESTSETKPLPEAAQSPDQTGGPPDAAQGQAAEPGAPAGAPSAAAGAPNSNPTAGGNEQQKTQTEKTQEELQPAANGPAAAAAADAPAAGETAAAAAGSEASASPETAAQQEPAAAAATAAPPAAAAAPPAAAAAPPAAAAAAAPAGAAEAPKPAAAEAEPSAAAAEAGAAAEEAQQQEREGSGAAADAAQTAAAAKLQQQQQQQQQRALQAAQVAAVKETNAAVVMVLVVASLALVFELYLMYACWSFKVWLERGYEAVVLAGVAPFAPVDGGNGWLAYAVRMPQTVQLETYGGNAGGAGHLPVFVQTTDSSDCFANVNLPMTGRW
ncbi:hypothetical protein, conserved [Eimeria necatrix]|uniref:Uncharacterized protein n=1 Tax=Eimeria necatrix TaxID=51315 RepID=U6MQL1_9EIME|nr:hypothetical protein, conserved [Eimeria necatrix]CDJ64754.1 hypothetical protein, conserved [Eimeria necatrix]